MSLLVLSAALFAAVTPTRAEVYISTQRVADRLAFESRIEAGEAERPASHESTSEQAERKAETADVPETQPLTPPPSNFDNALRPLRIFHVGHGRLGYDRGHLPGAVYLDVHDFYVDRDGLKNQLPDPDDLVELLSAHGVGPGMDLLLYGDAAGIFPARVYVALSMIGLDEHAYILDGQLKRWAKERRKIDTDTTGIDAPRRVVVPAHPRRAPDMSRLSHSRVVRSLDANQAAEAKLLTPFHLDNRPFAKVVIDARSPRQFAGNASIKGIDARGHLPDATNLAWTDLIADAQDPVLAEDAAERIAQLLPVPNARVLAHDETGNQASVLFAVLRHFGVDAYFDERGIVGYVRDGGTLVKPE